MKFSYPLLKKLVPGLKRKAALIEALTLRSFEAEDAEGNTLEVNLPPNRWADAASHWGLAREAAAVLSLPFAAPAPAWPAGGPASSASWRTELPSPPKSFSVTVEERELCPRYTACAFEEVRVGPSPKWMQEALIDCGLRPISNVVDIMNFVMLETGQPLHAFDLDKLESVKIKDQISKLSYGRHGKAKRLRPLTGRNSRLTPRYSSSRMQKSRWPSRA